MGKNKKGNKNTAAATAEKQLPFVSICTPTFNRRPFYSMIIKCFENQTYPKDRMEWIIIDDGTDKIEDLVSHIPQVKYFKYDTRMNLGKKRNLMHEKSKGDIIVYMDDDDYYPIDRVSHAVEMLQKNPKALCAGSSEMFLYFKHIQKMYKFGPYGPNHSTAATFAFRRELLKITRYDDHAALAEEKAFLKDYTIPFVQLDSMKTILVFSHIHNSFDKKPLLDNPGPFVTPSAKTVDDFVKDPEIKKFFMEDIDNILNDYDPGSPKHKPEVLKQMGEMKKKREEIARQQMEQQEQQRRQIANMNPIEVANAYENKLAEQGQMINNIMQENNVLKIKIDYLEKKISELIKTAISNKKICNDVNSL
jgi:glycosyltransferase involved in cell wall biosynthesis